MAAIEVLLVNIVVILILIETVRSPLACRGGSREPPLQGFLPLLGGRERPRPSTKRRSCVVLSPRRTYAKRLAQASGGGSLLRDG